MKNVKLIKAITVIAGAGILAVGFQNCSGGFSTIDPVEKASLLSSMNVLAPRNTNGDISGVIPVDGGNGGSTGSNIPVVGGGNGGGGHGGGSTGSNIPVAGGSGGGGGGHGGGSTGSNIPVTGQDGFTVNFVCSTERGDKDASLLLAKSVYYRILDLKTKQIVYEPKIDILQDILNKKSLTIPQQFLVGNMYELQVYDEKQVSLLSKDTPYVIRAGARIDLIYDGNPDHLGSSGRKVIGDSSKCDQKASPLVVSLGTDVKLIDLSSPTRGILFDILGQRSLPQAYTPKRISWFKKTPGSYYFVTLPDRSGEVHGIDQMFGDNTMGPDRKFAANGYKALEKYDDNHDGLITKEDKIFDELRLWHDTNLDGVGIREELHSLKDMDVVSIDLNYDDKYYEADIYGNETRMKSVVKTGDGKLHLIFDLWFRYLNK